MTPIGRAPLIESLARRLAEGEQVLLYGPVGAGKTSVVRALTARFLAARTACGLSERTAAVQDFTRALASAYPAVATAGVTRRRLRSRLRAQVDARPPVVLLDHVEARGTALKSALKPLRGTGAGVLIVVDVEHERDHQDVRALRLAYHEVAIPRLHGRSIQAALRRALDGRRLPYELVEDDLRRLAALAEGLPGRAVAFAEALTGQEAWRDGHPRYQWLRSEAAIRAAETHRGALSAGGPP